MTAAEQAVNPAADILTEARESGHGNPLTVPLLPPTFGGHPRSDTAASAERSRQAALKDTAADSILQLTSDAVRLRHMRCRKLVASRMPSAMTISSAYCRLLAGLLTELRPRKYSPTSSLDANGVTNWPCSASCTFRIPSMCLFSINGCGSQILARREKGGAEARGIPLGALVTPLPVGGPAPPVLPRQPTSCRQCGAYVNCYCEVDSKSSAGT